MTAFRTSHFCPLAAASLDSRRISGSVGSPHDELARNLRILVSSSALTASGTVAARHICAEEGAEAQIRIKEEKTHDAQIDNKNTKIAEENNAKRERTATARINFGDQLFDRHLFETLTLDQLCAHARIDGK